MSNNDSEEQNSSVQCPTCGSNDFKNTQGLAIHHGKVHGEPLPDTNPEVVCEQCGETKTIPRCQDDGRRHFCDADCHGKWISENQSGEDSHRYNSIEVECAWCGDEKTVTPATDRRNHHHFCGRECWRQWRSENTSGEQSWHWSRVETECSQCSTAISPRRHRFEENDECFCGIACYAQWQSENRYGEDHHQYKGGSVKYGPGWSESKREAVRERQNRQCAGCGLSEEKNGRRLDVHHVTKARKLDDPTTRNGDDNLVALCMQCHPKWEKMAPLRPIVE